MFNLRKPETERFADLKHRQECYQAAKRATAFLILIVFLVGLSAFLIAIINFVKERTLSLTSNILLIVTGTAIVLSLLIFIFIKLDNVHVKLQL